MKISRYWDIADALHAHGVRRETELGEEFESLLRDSVRCRLLADVPVGAFLSGGLDSTVVTSLMSQISSARVKTFSMGFTSESYDETNAARAVACQLGTDHVEHFIDEMTSDQIGKVLDEFGEPFADASALPSYYLCESTSREVKVALSGDGADELLGGYNRYRVGHYHDAWSRFSAVSGVSRLSPMTRILPERHGYYGGSINKKLKHVARMLDMFIEQPEAASSRVFSCEELEQLYPQGLRGAGVSDPVLCRDKLDASRAWPDRMLWADCRSYLPDDILVKVDRMSMAHSLEVRSPFLDYRLVELLTRVPMSSKLHGGVSKVLLRHMAAREFPDVAKRPKHGFEAPVAQWLAGILFDHLMSLLENCPLTQLDVEGLKHYAMEHREGRRDHSRKLWTIYVMLRWLESNT